MTTLLLHHPASREHRTPTGHPERPARAEAVEKAISAERFASLTRRLAEPASSEMIARVHPAEWIDAIERIAPREGLVGIDPDTVMSSGTLDAVRRGAGAACQAVDAVMTGEVANAFSAMRPPGHHAERTRAMGFCFFNNVAIAARHAQAAHGAERVAIVDWDVHHGNGTQDVFWADGSVLFCSTHEMPLYPGTGAASERGDHDTIVNTPLHAGDDGVVFREAFAARVLPRVEAFRPDLILISAGFDAHRRDPLANLMLEAEDFAWATREVMELAARHCSNRIVSLLEGGYDLQALADSAAAHVGALQEA